MKKEKKEYLLHWEIHNYGTSRVRANNKKEVREIVSELGYDLANIKEDDDWQDHLWEIVKIEEIK